MADVHRARRDAEKAARAALGGTLVDTAGELGAVVAGQAEAVAAIAAARAKASALLKAAHTEGAALIADARVKASEADNAYATAWTAGKQAGWTPAQLRAMGYPKPPAARRLASAASSDTDADGAVSTPPHQSERDTGRVERVA